MDKNLPITFQGLSRQPLSRILIEILNISIYHPDRMFYDAFDITRVQGAPGHLEASLSEGLNLGQMSPFWNPNGCQKGSKVVKYSVCWCILPL